MNGTCLLFSNIWLTTSFPRVEHLFGCVLCLVWLHSKSFAQCCLCLYITGYVARLTRRVSLVEQELLTLLGHMSSPPGFSGVRVTRSLVLYVCFVDRCLSFCTFSFGHCVVCYSPIYGFWNKSWMRKGQGSVYDKWNISVVIIQEFYFD
jgi:hypothetical protein